MKVINLKMLEELFNLEQQLDIPYRFRFHNSVDKKTLKEILKFGNVSKYTGRRIDLYPPIIKKEGRSNMLTRILWLYSLIVVSFAVIYYFSTVINGSNNFLYDAILLVPVVVYLFIKRS